MDTPSDQVENSEHIVIYEMTSDGTNASITYASVNGDGTLGVEQVAVAPTPFTKQLSVTGDLSAYSLVGQANDGTTISCKITVDTLWGASLSSGPSRGRGAALSSAHDAFRRVGHREP